MRDDSPAYCSASARWSSSLPRLAGCGKKDEAGTAAAQVARCRRSPAAALRAAAAAQAQGAAGQSRAGQSGRRCNGRHRRRYADRGRFRRHPSGDRRPRRRAALPGRAGGRQKGAKLVTFDPAEYRAQLAGTSADARTETQRYERAKELLEKNFISQEALDVAQGNMERALARKRSRTKSLLSKTTIMRAVQRHRRAAPDQPGCLREGGRRHRAAGEHELA